MKIKDYIKDLRTQELPQLGKTLATVQKEYFKLRIQFVDGQNKNFAAIRDSRKKVAIIKTIMRERNVQK